MLAKLLSLLIPSGHIKQQRDAKRWRRIYAINNAKTRRLHRYHRDKAKRVIKKLRASKSDYSDAQRLMYLKQVDHWTFEKLVLEILSEDKYKIVDDERFTGDGGVDGRILKSGEIYLVQAKRYTRYVKTKDIEAFYELCLNRRCQGYFVHTGITPANAKQYAGDVVEIISGEKLIKLLTR